MNTKQMIVLLTALAGGWLTVSAETPDFFADKITSDGAGYIDTGYCYKRAAATESKTSKVVLDCYDVDRCGYSDSRVSRDSRRTYFSFWWNYNSGRISHVQYSGKVAGITGHDWSSATGLSQTPASGDQSITLSYDTGKGSWGDCSFDMPQVGAYDMKSALCYYLFARNYNGKASAFGIYDLKNFRIYESADGGATETLVRDFVPAYVEGRVGVYDRKTGLFCPALTKGDGFILSGYDIDLAAGKTLLVTAACMSPRTLKLAAGSTLAFDGRATMTPATTVELPDSGTVAISLAKTGGRGRYVLLDNLPADYDLARFSLGSLPAGTTGTLAKDGTTLVLTLQAPGTPVKLPEAFCDYITSDHTNHIDVGYCFTYGTSVRTSRIQMDFETANCGRFPSESANDTYWPAVFGYFEASGAKQSRCNYRYDESVSCGERSVIWNDVEFENYNGPQRIVVDYVNALGIWNNEAKTINPPTTSSKLSYWISGVNGLVSNPIGKHRSYMDIRHFQVWETNTDEKVEVLVRDLVPCVSAGRAALYDFVTGEIYAPTNPVNSYTCSTPAWRLTMGGDVGFYKAGTAVELASPASATGYVLVNDRTGAVWRKGLGDAVSVVMPDFPLSVHWTANGDETVGAGQTLTVSGTTGYRTLTLAAGATLAFEANGCLMLSEGLVVPSSGTVAVRAAGITRPGTYVLAVGVTDSLDPDVFAFEPSDYGMKGVIGRRGDRLVLSLTEDPSVPGAIVGVTLTSDARCWVDSGYHYRNGTTEKTSRVQFDYTMVNYGRLPGATLTENYGSFLGYYSGGNALTYCRYSRDKGATHNFSLNTGNDAQTWQVASFTNCNGRQSLTIDYAHATATWKDLAASRDEDRTIYPSQTKLEPRSYWLAGVNGNSKDPGYLDILHFQAWETDGQGQNETLVCDIVPATKAGAIGVYDRVAKAFVEPTCTPDAPHGYRLDMGTVTQEFAAVSTVCNGQLVTCPSFAPQNALMFTADGMVTAKAAIDALILTRYDVSGAVLSTETVASVMTGRACAVALNGAAKAVVEIVGASLDTLVQSFAKATAESADELLEREVAKYECEYMVPGAATLTFKADVVSVVADLYDATGAKIGEEPLAGPIGSGTPWAVAPSPSAAYRILRVSLRHPGCVLIVR